MIAIGPAVATLMLSICSTSVRLLGVIPERNKANGKRRLVFFFEALFLDAGSILISLFLTLVFWFFCQPLNSSLVSLEISSWPFKYLFQSCSLDRSCSQPIHPQTRRVYRKNGPPSYSACLSSLYADPGMSSFLPLWYNLVSLRFFIKSLEILFSRFVFLHLILVFVGLVSISVLFPL